MGLFTRETETAPCTVEVVHKFEELSAHVRLDDGSVIHPGDSVKVHGTPVMAPFGAAVSEKRTATITRASRVERLWTRLTGDLEVMELCEFSFSDEFRATGTGGEETRPRASGMGGAPRASGMDDDGARASGMDDDGARASGMDDDGARASGMDDDGARASGATGKGEAA